MARLGDWRVEPRRNRIVSVEAERSLDPRLIDVLVTLATRPGEVLTRDELLEAVWKDTFVSENSLSQAVSRLRKALGDDRSDGPQARRARKGPPSQRHTARIVAGHKWTSPECCPGEIDGEFTSFRRKC